MGYGRRRGFFFYLLWAAVLSLAVVGGASLYHNFTGTTEAVTKTANATGELASEGYTAIEKQMAESKAKAAAQAIVDAEKAKEAAEAKAKGDRGLTKIENILAKRKAQREAKANAAK